MIGCTSLLLVGCGAKLTKEQWKAKLGEGSSVFRQTGTTVQISRDDLIKRFGKPSKTETSGGSTFWYYDCKDGKIQLDVNSGALTTQGMLIGSVNDF